MRMGHLRWIAVLFVAVGSLNAALARQAVVTMNDGRTLRGEVLSEDDQTVTLSIATIATPIAVADIREIKYVESIAEQYQHRRAELKDDDIEGRYLLANWLFDNQEYQLAARELADLSGLAPDDARIKTLRQVVDERLKAADEPAAARPDEPRPSEPGAAPGAAPAGEDADDLSKQVLSAKQINLIKVYEIDLDERPPVAVPREIIDRLFKEYADRDQTPKGASAQTAYRRAPGWQQLGLLFEIQARPLYSEVEVRTDPPALAMFRRDIHMHYVVNYCATAKCHGGKDAGEFYLFRDSNNREEYVYTNFFILNAYENKDGLMINRNEPSRSLLVQYGLDRKWAKTPHPEVTGWRPEFNNQQAPRYEAVTNWIGSLYPSPPTKYGIEYQPPKAPKSSDESQPPGEPEPGQPPPPAPQPAP